MVFVPMPPEHRSVHQLAFQLCRELIVFKQELVALATSSSPITLAQRNTLERQGRVVLSRFADYLKAVRQSSAKGSTRAESSVNRDWLLQKWEKL